MRHVCRTAFLAGTALVIVLSTAGSAVARPFHHHRFPGPAAPAPRSPSLTNHVFFDGATLSHAIPGGSEPLSQPDDITFGDGHIFVAFQNAVGPQGQPSPSGNLDSTIVELTLAGQAVNQWDAVGHVDGLTADPYNGQVVATSNEDANSSLYTIDPSSGALTHYDYNENPLPHNGGTDAIEFYNGMMLISASAPGTPSAAEANPAPAPQPTYPAVYQTTLDPFNHVAYVKPLFYDESTATLANVGPGFDSTLTLGLTDPDSNEDVPFYAPRFAGEFMLTSQGDEEQIFVRHAATPRQSLSVLKLTASVDDTAWPSDPSGALYTTDNNNGTVDEITGPFQVGSVLAAVTPCDENGAPATCPAPGYPPNYLGLIDPWTGVISAVPLNGPAVEPQGMLFLPGATRLSRLGISRVGAGEVGELCDRSPRLLVSFRSECNGRARMRPPALVGRP